jgi:beta-xylosidase
MRWPCTAFPLDWNHWQIHEWPERIAEIQAVTHAAGVGDRGRRVHLRRRGGAGVRLEAHGRTAGGRVPRIHWYSLYDLPKAWPATTRHREAEGSSYYRHFHMGLLREDGTPKLACAQFPTSRPSSASASGSTTRTTGSTMPCAG